MAKSTTKKWKSKMGKKDWELLSRRMVPCKCVARDRFVVGLDFSRISPRFKRYFTAGIGVIEELGSPASNCSYRKALLAGPLNDSEIVKRWRCAENQNFTHVSSLRQVYATACPLHRRDEKAQKRLFNLGRGRKPRKQIFYVYDQCNILRTVVLYWYRGKPALDAYPFGGVKFWPSDTCIHAIEIVPYSGVI